ncbi:MAG: hypothetical protein P4L36_16805 [Holophaga sp.]|nr:hypothetical protein [Holophaga sp.]
MLGTSLRPTAPPRKSADFGRGWAGLLLIAAGLGAAGLAPAVSEPASPAFLPMKGPVGIRVILEGDGLETTRVVRFGALEASFKVLGPRRVETRVPEGAASAPITLVSAEGRVLTTGAAFQVTPEQPGPPAMISPFGTDRIARSTP